MRGWIVLTLVVIVATLVVGIQAPGFTVATEFPSPASNSAVGWINVSATDSYGFAPNEFQRLPTNASITVTFTDATVLANTFTIIGKEGWVIPSSYSSAQIDELAYGGSPPNLVNVNVTGSGDVNRATFESPGRGWYEFICTEPGHFQLGMYGFVAFGMNLPSNLTTVHPLATDLSGSATSASSVVLDWKNPAAGEFTNITILYGTSNASLTSAISAGTATTITISGLDSDTNYYFAVEAWNNSVNGPVSPHIAVTTQRASPSGGGMILGVSQTGWYVLIGAIAVVAIGVAMFVIRSQRNRNESTRTAGQVAGSGPPNPPK